MKCLKKTKKNNLFLGIWDIIIWPFLLGIGQVVIILFLSFSYVIMEQIKTKQSFDAIVKSATFSSNLDIFLTNFSPLVTLILILLFGFYYLKKYEDKLKISFKTTFNLSLLGLDIALFINMFLLILASFTNIQIFTEKTFNLSIFLASVILGPILEEIIFRGIMYNKAKKYFGIQASAFIVSLVFSFLHFNIYKIIYIFFLSYLLIYLYEKNKTLVTPIWLHIIFNLVGYLFNFQSIFFIYLDILLALFVSALLKIVHD